jgi:AcrR family transcriptional regulator
LRRLTLDAARRIVARDGLRGLSARRIAEAIGYTPGMLYQLFPDLDGLVMEMNADTLEALLGACGASAGEDDPEPTLHRLAQAYVDFVAARPLLWRAVVEHAPPEGRQRPPRHRAAVAALLGLAETALAPLTGPPPAGRARHHARVLWAGLDGIVSLATSGNLAADETPAAMAGSLVDNYVAGLRAR